ncbi:hypothetical protein SCH01S_52_00510 [Sphingomonas changbaiensis NBRC 104936]|uniref:Ice-binding protein C-terminal domain-containing protein n=1 Tax=Sphingomonas changbaiensis NBRC 104936 TaxID=1219043 RepID=A0A0E9MTT0_9SPHN|nr:PEPxxWA-CTERM sorting domain-containing protein [Sphingomonas changbaiensis]GAO40868.1 hypothetical protein SCH01S_52_00510 [Sphingomonas changbaiensis NBRC 104936]
MHFKHLLLLASSVAAPAAAAIKYDVTELKPLPGFARGAVGDESYGINNAGQTVGRMRNADPFTGARAAVWDRSGNATQLATPDAAWTSKADGINRFGVISGDIGVGTPGAKDTRRGVRWTNPNNYQFIVPDNGYFSSGDLINDNGWIGGIRFNASADAEFEDFTAYVWKPDGSIQWVSPGFQHGRVEWFGANNSNVFAGTQSVFDDQVGDSYAAVTWTEIGGLTALPTRPDHIGTSASDINEDGLVSGGDYDGNVTDTGLWWDAAHNLHTLSFVAGTTGSITTGINNRNQIVGFSADENVCDIFGDQTCRRASLWDLNGNATDLNTLIDPKLGYTLLFANGINDLGQIYGEAMDATGRRFLFLARPVPEPATWAMMILGFGLVGGAARRRVPAIA